MEIPHRGSRPMALPEIYVHDSNPTSRYRNSSRSSSYNSTSPPPSSSIPMSIPNSREPVPPPLPPPRHLADIASGGNNGPDIAWKWGNSHEDGRDWGRSISSVAPGSSLYGGSFASRRSTLEERPEFPRRQSSTATIKSSTMAQELRDKDNSYSRFDEGYASLSGTSIGSNMSKNQDSNPGRGFQSSVHDKYRSNAQAYDKSLLQKLDSRRGIDNKTPPRNSSNSTFSSSASDASPRARLGVDPRHPSQLKPLSLPILTNHGGFTESPISRWADTPTSSGRSPGNTYSKFGGSGNYNYRSSSHDTDAERSPLPFTRTSGSGSNMGLVDDTSSVGSRVQENYDSRVSPDHEADFQMEETGLRRLYIEDYANSRHNVLPRVVTAGQKRRASSPPSPPGDEAPSLHTVGSASDLFRRRESAARASPTPHFHSTTGSVSSTCSQPRNNSYTSTMSLTTSSLTSLGSFGRLSPGGISPGGISPATDTPDSPYVNSVSLNSSPRGSISRQSHQRTISESRPLMNARNLSDGTDHAKHPNLPRVQGVLLCECCPKKPKKFDSHDDLIAHEQEKQYECAYCKNRFKNKNEAERHQNSLHLRRHSWSCAALSGFAAVFHTSPTRPNDADTCGYCGEDFPRTGLASPSSGGPHIPMASDQDWDVRIAHLQEMHKFGECNHAKKFFRADHFRQHLKHSHAGTSGKWTNMLENACMKDEPLPEPIRGPERISPGGARVGRINEEEEDS